MRGKYMPTIKGVHWGFTLNFDGELPTLVFDEEKVQYAIWQHEKVEHDHLQGYLQMKSRDCTLKQLMKVFDPHKPHFERLVINKEGRKPWEYASKVESRVAGPWEFGIRIERGSSKGKKIEACERSPERMSIEDPDLFRMVQSRKKMKIFIEEYQPPETLRPWQEWVDLLIADEPDDRKIIWVYGAKGGEGKTTYGKMLVKRGWAYIDPSKLADMWEMYHQQGTEKNLVLDFHRACRMEHFYAFIEKAKNRVIPKIKYRSNMHIEMNNIHLVVLSNRKPDLEMISEDRLVLIDCSAEKDDTREMWCVVHKVFQVNGTCMHCRTALTGKAPTIRDSVTAVPRLRVE